VTTAEKIAAMTDDELRIEARKLTDLCGERWGPRGYRPWEALLELYEEEMEKRRISI
jgi:hypothetical protein